jgi:hypothetical protein
MRSIVVAALALAVVACSDETVLATNFAATLDGNKERPAISPVPTGVGTADCTTDGSSNFTCVVNYSGLSAAPTAAHIHLGAANTTGAVVVHLCGGGGTPASAACPAGTSGNFTATSRGVESNSTYSAVISAMRGATAYVNVHTSAYPNGAIRGQTVPTE